ncbi:hypothetical protein EV201_2397 [Ancylomarina subtilis]|uniref:Uncharacterized protein n=1 Tax=Ancylomarina subtilis TaxID=1639035 RepID=A0A4Q7V9R6_9BACT|nr:hypothetical protein EV201_2397 [Ancylomarina subtilis]
MYQLGCNQPFYSNYLSMNDMNYDFKSLIFEFHPTNQIKLLPYES